MCIKKSNACVSKKKRNISLRLKIVFCCCYNNSQTTVTVTLLFFPLAFPSPCHSSVSFEPLSSGCGSVGRAIASDTRGPRFEYSHRLSLGADQGRQGIIENNLPSSEPSSVQSINVAIVCFFSEILTFALFHSLDSNYESFLWSIVLDLSSMSVLLKDRPNHQKNVGYFYIAVWPVANLIKPVWS